MPKGVPKFDNNIDKRKGSHWKVKHDRLLKNFNRFICHLRYLEKKNEELADAHVKFSWDRAIAKASANNFSTAKTLGRDYRDDKDYLYEMNLYKQPKLNKLIEEEEKNASQKNTKE